MADRRRRHPGDRLRPARTMSAVRYTTPAVAAIVGLGIGILYGQIHAGAVLCLGTWGIAGLVFGAATTHWKLSAASGALFGFAVSLFFLIGGYQGAKPIYDPLPFFVVLSLFGAVSGAALGAVGWLARTRVLRR